MKKISVLAFTMAASIIAAGSAPMVSLGAMNPFPGTYTGSYGLPGGSGRVIVIGGSGIGDLPQPGIFMPDMPQLNTPERPDAGEDYSGSYNEVHRVAALVNEERARAGLAPLVLDATLSAAAQTRVMETVGTFSHTRPDGSSFSTALTALGVNYRAAGENIAYGQRTPEEAMEGWMNSAGHRANILSTEYTSIGVGHFKSGGVDYWTQIFIR